jgi:hypothetical protein
MHYAATAVIVPATSDVLWGVAAIARYLNQTEAAARWQIEQGRYPVKKIGKVITARASELDKLFTPKGDVSGIPQTEAHGGGGLADSRSKLTKLLAT